MPKFSKLSKEKKAVIVALRNEKLSMRDIAKRVKCSVSTVCDFLKKYKETGSIERKKGSGKKRATTAREDRMLERMSLRNRQATSAELSSEWSQTTGKQICASTVRRRLISVGLNARRPRKKPLLTKKMRTARLKWAQEHENWTQKQWSRVIFSDESKFNLHGTDGIQFVRRRRGEEFKAECIKSTVKFPTSVMVWGCITADTVGPLHFVEGTVKADDYIKILQEKLLPFIKDKFRTTKSCIFQDDSAPCHRAKKVTEFIARNRIVPLEWPGNSPDMNPIENCWYLISKKLSQKKPINKTELRNFLEKVWNEEVTPEYLKNLIYSMPNRIKAVIKARGGATKY